MKKFDQYFIPVYNRYNVLFVKGDGKYLYDNRGKRYLDFFSGLSVTNLGHCNKNLVAKLITQAKLLWHCSNLYYTQPQILLAKELVKRSFPAKVFFSNSGAEANECAIKLVRKYGSKSGKYEIISFKNSFHGRTLATLTATGQKKFHVGFKPLLEGFKYAEFNNINSVIKSITSKTVAVMVEPIQGEGGVIPASKKFLQQLRELCNKKGLILIFDEIQTGIGRTGELFAFQYYNVKPDIVTLAKSIANGIPLGVTIVDRKYADVLKYGEHGSTFGGNLLACAVAYEVLKNINKNLLNNVKKVGQYFFEKLTELKNKHKSIISIRGVGLMLGAELDYPAREVVEKCLKQGVVINVTQDNILRFLPPLTVEKSDIDVVIETLDKIIK